MIKTLKKISDNQEKFRVPQSVQDLIPIQTLYAKSVQGDTGHSKTDTLINTCSHIEDPMRMHLSHTIAEDFYGTPAKPVVTATTDIIELIKNNPEIKRKAYEALVGEFS